MNYRDIIVKLYNEGYNLKQISELVDISYFKVKKIIKESNNLDNNKKYIKLKVLKSFN